MARVGEIYWGTRVTGSGTSAVCTLFLSGEYHQYATNRWDQTPFQGKSGIMLPPWYYASTNGIVTDGNISTYSVSILQDVTPIFTDGFFGYIECSNSGESVGTGTLFCSNINGAERFHITYNCESLHGMFRGARFTRSLSEIFNFAKFDTSNVTRMDYMFDHVSSTGFTDLDLSSFDTKKVSNMWAMFYECISLQTIDISSFTIESLEHATSMFNGCSNLRTIYVQPDANWSTSTKLINSTGMFTGCTALVGGNGTAHGTSTTANQNDKTRARMDKAGQAGYFTLARRTIAVSSTQGSGSGSYSGVGEYDYGTVVTFSARPENGSYMHSIKQITNLGTEELLTADTLTGRSFTFALTKNTAYELVFETRPSVTLTVEQEDTDYTIQGTGTYLYLDTPTLIADLNAAPISFLGWYKGEERLSNKNPYSFVMPNENLTLIAKFGDTPFEDELVRQFILTNRDGEVYKLTSRDSNIFLNEPRGLGYEKDISSIRLGNAAIVLDKVFKLPNPSGAIVIHSSPLEDTYGDFDRFVRFSVKSPITLWYKIPLSTEDKELIADIYHLPVEIVSLDKSEVDENGSLNSSINFQGIGFWKHSQSISEVTSSDITVYNGGDLDAGIDFTMSKGNGTAFSNPKITLSSGDEEYGICALEGTFTKIRLNSRDGEQALELWNNGTLLENPFSYLNFSESDGVKTFPYPKLKNGTYSKISISYDGIGQESQNIIVIYDEEYVSV